MICSVCRQNPAQFTDSTESVYCGKVCQITGNLTVLMSDKRWNKDTLLLLLYPLNDHERIALLDALLRDSPPDQRNRLIRWIDEFEKTRIIHDVVFECIFSNLTHLLLYYPNLTMADYRYLKDRAADEDITFDMFRVIMGKLTNHGDIGPYFLVNLLSHFIVQPRKLEYVLEHYQFSDWVIQLIRNTQENAKILKEHTTHPGDVKTYLRRSLDAIFSVIEHATDVLKNPVKRRK